MHLVVCPHCWRQLKLARSGAEFPAGPVCCRYCGAVFSAAVMEVPDDAPMPVAQDVYEHLRVEYDSSHLYNSSVAAAEVPAPVEAIDAQPLEAQEALADDEIAAEVSQTQPKAEAEVPEVQETPMAKEETLQPQPVEFVSPVDSEEFVGQLHAAEQSVEEISKMAQQSQAAQTPEPEFAADSSDQAGEKKIAARAAGHSHDDGEIEIDEPRIAKRPEPQSTPTQEKPQPKVEAPKSAPTPVEPKVVAKPQPKPVKPVAQVTPAASQAPKAEKPQPAKLPDAKPAEAKKEIKPQPTESAKPVVKPADQPAKIHKPKPAKPAETPSLKKEDVKFVAPPKAAPAPEPMISQPVEEKFSQPIKPARSWPIKAAVFLLVIGCIYAIYAGAAAVLDRQGKDADIQAAIKKDIQTAAKKKAQDILASPADDIELIDATVTELEEIANSADANEQGFTGKFINTKTCSLDIARVEITLTSADGKTVTLKSNQYNNIPPGSEIMFSVMAGETLPQDSIIDKTVVKGAKAAPNATGWNIDKFSRRDNDGLIKIFGQTLNKTSDTLDNIYIWCDFFTSDGLFVGSAKGTVPADVTKLTPGSKVSFNINFEIDQSADLMPQAVEFARPRLMGQKSN